MIFDWKNNREEALSNGIWEKMIFSSAHTVMKAKNKVVAHHTFRNFESLEFEEGTLIEDCIFEDCGDLSFDECRIENCLFTHIGGISSDNCYFTNSKFNKLECCDDMSFIDCCKTKISYCSFEDVEFRDDSYLCDGDEDCWIEHCSFTNIRTDCEAEEIIIGRKTVGKIFQRTERVCIVDEDTCIGLDCVDCL